MNKITNDNILNTICENLFNNELKRLTNYISENYTILEIKELYKNYIIIEDEFKYFGLKTMKGLIKKELWITNQYE